MRALRRAVRRALLPVALLALALTGGVAPAQAAITVSNPGTVTASGSLSGTATLNFFPVTMTCATVNMSLSVSSSGAVQFTSVLLPMTATCSDGLGGSLTVTAVSLPWTAQIKGSTGAYRWDSVTMRLRVVSTGLGATCDYNGGTVTSVNSASPLQTIAFQSAGPLTSTTSGCGNLTIGGALPLSKSITVSGSL